MQVRDVTAESYKPLKEAQCTHETDAAKDTPNAATSPEPGVGEEEPTQATEKSFSKEKKADQNVPKEADGGPEELDVQELPPQEPEKTGDIKTNEETAAPKFSDAVAEPENKENEMESAIEPSKQSPGDSEMSCTPETATQKEAPAAVEPQEVKEEVAQPEPIDDTPPERVEDEVPESGDKECEEATTKVDAAQKETRESSGAMPAGSDKTAEQASEDQGGEEAATATEAEPKAAVSARNLRRLKQSPRKRLKKSPTRQHLPNLNRRHLRKQ
ncbi:neurofilament medium polypeptide-like [Dermacentor silvarum]|uniref:neurofilament medium polypeptide-like n=1 Tax=Dermacentor silvarum TaxID=543639 RepID=UPI0021015BCB|nr:neurofilament medium polypeptide-like [Dermacentor silvarum]